MRVDFLFTTDKLFEKVRRDYTTVKRFAERDVRCAPVEGLLLMKLAALPDKYKRAHFDRVELYENDVLMLMRSFHPNLSTLFDVLSIYMLESDVAEVRKIVADIEDRITRQSQRFRNDHS